MVRRSFRVVVPFCLAITTSVASWAATAPPPQVAIAQFPQGIMQAVGGPTDTDDFVIANPGATIASVTLVANKNFFAVTPSSFSLLPGQSQTVTIRPNVSAGGLYDGAISVFVAGVNQPLVVPVRLFIGNRPVGVVDPRPSTTQIIVAPVAGAQHAGSANVRNAGNVTMQGILVADVPWIVPGNNSVIGIAQGATAQMGFTVDAAQRPDAVAPLGAMIGNFSMIYLRGTIPAAQQTGTVKVQVIDINKAAVVTQQPSALAAGEIAAFVPGITDTGGYFTDVFLSNRSPATLSNVRLFYNAIGSSPASSLLANIAQIPAGVSGWFPFAPSSLFNVASQTGTVQVRGTQGSVSISAIRGGVPDGVNRYLTAMPTLTSDRSVTVGERLLFAGVEKSTAAHTDLFVQEAAGFAAAYTIDFFDGAGAPVAPSRSGSLLPFGLVSLADTVPTGARSARVSNTSTGAARLTGFATVIDESTRDAWTVIDFSRAPVPSANLFLPLPVLTDAPPSTFDAWISNGSGSAISVTVGTSVLPARRRAVGKGASPPASGSAIVLAAGETKRVPITNAPLGYVRISGPVGAFSATGRLTSTVFARPGAFGTGVPALPAASGGGMGSVKRFSRAADVPNVSPATLLLLESASKPATVRVTVRFTFPAGSTVSGQVTGSKDYDLAPAQLLTIPQLVRTILGPGRDTLGIIYNLVIDVEVIGGEGKILPFLQTIDTSGDLTLSAD